MISAFKSFAFWRLKAVKPSGIEPTFVAQKLLLALILPFLFLGLKLQAAPPDPQNYQVLSGGLINIENGAYVEGSISKGGIQPDYKIDLESEPLKSFLEKCKMVGEENIPFWEKVGKILKLTKTDYFKYRDYHNPYYRRLLKKYRNLGEDVPLSEYGKCSAGVCREHALVLHFALKAAGIENLHAYAKIYRASNYYDFQITEDHAFNVVKFRGEEWVVDAYYKGFNGFRLKDLMLSPGITEHSVHAPVAEPGPGTRYILQMNSFPRVFNPILKLRCARAYSVATE